MLLFAFYFSCSLCDLCTSILLLLLLLLQPFNLLPSVSISSLNSQWQDDAILGEMKKENPVSLNLVHDITYVLVLCETTNQMES